MLEIGLCATGDITTGLIGFRSHEARGSALYLEKMSKARVEKREMGRSSQRDSRSRSLQRMVSTGKSETFDGLGVTWGCEREGLVRMGMRVAGV